MPPPIYTQTVIAFIWDFDRTLIPGYQQEPLFRHFGVDGTEFWNEVNKLRETYQRFDLRVSRDTAYLGHILSYVQSGRFAGLSNNLLRRLGAELEMAPGIPDLLRETRDMVVSNSDFVKHEIEVEHYVASTGLRKMIEGSPVGPHLNGIWANEFLGRTLGPGYLGSEPVMSDDDEISQVGYMIDNTTKTRAVFEINKGANLDPSVDVNQLIPQDERRVPIKNMIYVADGPSDVPVFSVLNQYGGKTFGVYGVTEFPNFNDVKSLQDQGRIQGMGEADFTRDSHTWRWLMRTLEEISLEIVETREAYLQSRPGAPAHRA
jgi:hypothetical protein